jgi:hypothetical protein
MKIVQRLFGIVTFKSVTYREIIENVNIWREPIFFIAFTALINSLSSVLDNGFTPQSIMQLTAPFISWILLGYLCSFFMKKIYKLDVPATNIMKIDGYVRLFPFLGMLLLGWNRTHPSHSLVNFLLSLFGFALAFLFYFANVIGVREASQASTGRAVLIFSLSFLTSLIVLLIYGKVVGVLL